MTIKEFAIEIAKVLGTSVKKIWSKLLNAKLSSIVKLGVFIGASVSTIVMIIKMLRDRRKFYKNKENKTPVDEALEKNYHDMRNQDSLHPLMKKVKKNLKKDIKPRLKKAARKRAKQKRRSNKELEDLLYELRENRRRREDDALRDEYESFINGGWRELDIDEACMDPDFGQLRRVWDSV